MSGHHSDFLEEQKATCPGILGPETQVWYTYADLQSKRFFDITVRCIHESAETLSDVCGALWTIRHLVSFARSLVCKCTSFGSAPAD